MLGGQTINEEGTIVTEDERLEAERLAADVCIRPPEYGYGPCTLHYDHTGRCQPAGGLILTPTQRAVGAANARAQAAYTADARLCDDAGMISDEPVTPGSPGTTFDPELTYRRLLNNLRHYTGLPPYTGTPVACTGSAHLAGEHFRCTNPIHSRQRAQATPTTI